ncbi:restart primosome assembly protein PriB [Noviherbaspirillum humi]|uniref:Replication restart protein PriB n=1 Tax=Noviherbaspirillum humi TaxID=1688639 RepID=A0A239D8V8_9BURK|nr:primosomal replication protein N [Noviherbaspirillum humi]SNS28729.1 restart primosome assembly protein PriB [Noviherbaspirillum humi]
MNRLELVACIAERDALRYTPAGIPIVAVKLQHESEQSEAGMQRQVFLDISAIAAGTIAGRLNGAELGKPYRFSGFLARKNRNSKSLVLHIVDFD